MQGTQVPSAEFAPAKAGVALHPSSLRRIKNTSHSSEFARLTSGSFYEAVKAQHGLTILLFVLFVNYQEYTVRNSLFSPIYTDGRIIVRKSPARLERCKKIYYPEEARKTK